MRRSLLLVAGVVLATPAPAHAAAGTRTLRCDPQAIGTFPDVSRGADNLVVGPVAFVGLRSIPELAPELITRVGGQKSPLVLRPGRAATISIDRGTRARARLWYGGGDRFDRAKLPHTLRLPACDEEGAKSRAGSRPVTFWAGGFAFGPEPFCLRFTVTVDGVEHRRRLPVGGGAC